MMGFFDDVSNWIGNTSGKIGEATKGILPTTVTEKTFKGASDAIGNASGKVYEVVGSTGEMFKSGLSKVTNTVGDVTGNIGKTLGDIGGGVTKYAPLVLAGVGGLIVLSVLKK